MLGDLLELATTVVNPDHSPDIQAHISGASSSARMAGVRRRKSQSVSSTTDANGSMPPPATPASGSALTKPARKSRAKSTTSPPGSPRPLVAVPTKSTETTTSAQGLGTFVATLVLSNVIETILQTVSSYFLATGELAAISRVPDSWVEIVGLLAYKVALLSFYWFGDFDAFDVASLTLLITTPSTLLLSLFYQISSPGLIVTTGTMIVSHALPYLIFRPISPTHKSRTRTSTLRLRNRSILTDPYTTIATSLLATAILAVTLQLSFATVLPPFLAANFLGLRTLEPAHTSSAGLPGLLIRLLPAGFACMEFLFQPSTAASASLHTAPAVDFDAVTSGFWGHVYWNMWGWYSVRQKELIWRSAILGSLVVVETVVFLKGVLQGVTLVGATGYAGVWGAGIGVLALVLNWVGGPSD